MKKQCIGRIDRTKVIASNKMSSVQKSICVSAIPMIDDKTILNDFEVERTYCTRILGNICRYWMGGMLGYKVPSKRLKVQLYTILIRPVVLYIHINLVK